jgi:hypothetical protein
VTGDDRPPLDASPPNDDRPPLDDREVEEQEAVEVAGPEDTSLLSTEPTGFVHGEEGTVERAGSSGD